MSSLPLSLDLPKRASLAAQVVAALRKTISDGVWKDYMPSERRLAELLQVSRPTIRIALHQLANEKAIEIHQGRRNRLLAPSQPSAKPLSRLVGLVMVEPVSHLALVTYQGISEMRTHLIEHGFVTEILVCPPGSAQVQRRKLDEFVRQNRLFCCVLLSVSKDIQLWFQQTGVPTLVFGSCHTEVKLPSLDVDNRSVCRHAAGTFISRGHRRIALIVPNSGIAGDLASEQGFREAAEQRKNPERIRATIIRHNGTAQHISAKLDALFSSDQAPTALLVAKPPHAFIVLIYLLKRGLSVPDTVSFIARDHDHIFDIVSPPIAHYAMEHNTYADRLSRLMLQMVNKGYLTPEPNLIFPKFVAGGTIKRLVG